MLHQFKSKLNLNTYPLKLHLKKKKLIKCLPNMQKYSLTQYYMGFFHDKAVMFKIYWLS